LSPYALACILNDAWRELVNERDPRILAKTLTRAELARRIARMAAGGERNPERLKAAAKADHDRGPA
jgi:hypothetical protein